MLEKSTAKKMIDKLLEAQDFTMTSLAQKLGIQKRTLSKVQSAAEHDLQPEKQLALIKLYCSLQAA